MKYAKLNNGQLEFSPNMVKIDDYNVHNPKPEQLKQLGYKEVVFSQPEEKKWYEPVPQWKEKKTQITQQWKYIKQPEPDYKSLVVQKISERYDHNDEIALIHKGSENPEYIAYREYVIECKEWAIAEFEEYNNA